MANTVFNQDLHVNGNLSASTMSFPSGSVDDTAVQAAANISYLKVQTLVPIMYYQKDGSVIASETQTVHLAKAAGTIVAVELRPGTVPSSGSYDVDVLRAVDTSGTYTTILSAAVTIDNGDTDDTLQTATLASTTFVDGDAFQIKITASTPTSSDGLCVVLWLAENAQ